DDDHATTAAWARWRFVVGGGRGGVIAVGVRGSRRWYIESPSTEFELVGAMAIGEQAVVTDAMEPCRNRRRNRRESTRTGRKKPFRQEIQRSPSGDSPPPGTMQCTCGWCWRFWPQVCSTAVTPMSAPRCLGSPAMVVSVSAAAVNSNPWSLALFW